MKSRVWILSGFALLLAGCGIDVRNARLFYAAMDAYRAGDRAALAATLEAFDATHAPADAAVVIEPCSPQDWDRRRAADLRGMIENLDRPTVFAMSEEARLVYFDTVVLSEVGPADAPDCSNTPDYEREARRLDTLHRAALEAFARRHNEWRADLKARYGDNLEARLKQGERVLAANHMLPGAREISVDGARVQILPSGEVRIDGVPMSMQGRRR